MKKLLCVCEDCGAVNGNADTVTDLEIDTCRECGSDYLQIAPRKWFFDALNKGKLNPVTANQLADLGE
jgi:hypothetical protein